MTDQSQRKSVAFYNRGWFVLGVSAAVLCAFAYMLSDDLILFVRDMAGSLNGAAYWLTSFGFSEEIAANLVSDGLVITTITLIISFILWLAQFTAKQIRVSSLHGRIGDYVFVFMEAHYQNAVTIARLSSIATKSRPDDTVEQLETLASRFQEHLWGLEDMTIKALKATEDLKEVSVFYAAALSDSIEQYSSVILAMKRLGEVYSRLSDHISATDEHLWALQFPASEPESIRKEPNIPLTHYVQNITNTYISAVPQMIKALESRMLESRFKNTKETWANDFRALLPRLRLAEKNFGRRGVSNEMKSFIDSLSSDRP